MWRITCQRISLVHQGDRIASTPVGSWRRNRAEAFRALKEGILTGNVVVSMIVEGGGVEGTSVEVITWVWVRGCAVVVNVGWEVLGQQKPLQTARTNATLALNNREGFDRV